MKISKKPVVEYEITLSKEESCILKNLLQTVTCNNGCYFTQEEEKLAGTISKEIENLL